VLAGAISHPEAGPRQLSREHAEEYEGDRNHDNRYAATNDATTLISVEVEARLAVRRAVGRHDRNRRTMLRVMRMGKSK